ncbi:MAG: SDR family NAD(P)-dependent oxidoreductase, partial [Tepidimonas ignava]
YARGLAREGAAVLVADIDLAGATQVAAEIRAAGGRAEACRVDVSDPASTKEMAAAAARAFGGVDILVNNAALFAALQRKPWDQITPEDFDRVMAVNLKGVWLCCLAAVPYMKPRGKGKIINIGSASIFGAGNGLAHYLASKMGVVGLTRALAKELGDDNICVNTLMPGSTDSGSNSA